MKRAPMVLCLGLLLVVASVSFAVNPDPYTDKEAYVRAVEDARLAFEANQPLTADQKALVVEHGFGQTPGELDLRGGPDAFGYTFVDSQEPDGPAYQWIDITPNGTQIVGMGDDDYRGPFDLGFNFPFYGNTYSQVYIGSNGYVSFGAGYTPYSNTAIPNASTPNNCAYFFWDDWYPPGGGQIWYGQSGGNWVCSFVGLYLGGQYLTCQVILYPNGTIKYQYQTIEGSNSGETIGIENSNGTIALQASLNAAPANYPLNSMAIEFRLSDMGTVNGTVTDATTGDPIQNAEVSLYQDGGFFRSIFTNALGFYTMTVDVGDYEIGAEAEFYVDSDLVPITIEDDVTITVDFELAQAEAPQIGVDVEALEFFCPWMDWVSQEVTLTNTGDSDLNWSVDIIYPEDELMAVEEPQTPPPVEMTLPTMEMLLDVPQAKRTLYTNLLNAYATLRDNRPLTLKERNMLGGAGILPPRDRGELDRFGGPDGGGYYFFDNVENNGPEFEWLDISQTGTLIPGMGDDGFNGPFQMGFNFPYYGNTYSQIYFGYNGSIGFTGTYNDLGTLGHTNIPNPSGPNNAIQFWQRDMHCGYGPTFVYYQTMDVGGDLAYVAEYNHIIQFGAGNNLAYELSCEVICFENGDIILQYLSMGPSLDRAGMTVGIENANGTAGTEICYNNAALAPTAGMAIGFTLNPNGFGGWLTVDPNDGELAPGDNTTLTFTANAATDALAPGDYTATVHISGTHPGTIPVDIPATITVLNPGGIEGVVTDFDTGVPLEDAYVYIWVDNEPAFEGWTNDLGEYAIVIGGGIWTATANKDGWYESDPVNIEVIDGEITVYDWQLHVEIPPAITVDPEFFVFELNWGDTDSDILTIGNVLGGLPLVWDSDITYLEPELMTYRNPTEILARREANLNNVPLINPIQIDGSSPGATFQPGYQPRAELDEGPYLILSTTSVNNSVLRAFNDLGVEYTHIATQSFAAVDMTDYGTVIIAMDGGTPTVDDFRAFFNFAVNGGTSIYLGGTSWEPAYQAILEYIGHTGQTGWTTVQGRPHFTIVDPSHDLSTDLPETYNFINTSASYYCVRYNDPEMEVAAQNGDNWPCLLSKEMGDGMYLTFTNSVFDGHWGNQADYEILRQIIFNMLEFQGGGWLTLEPTDGVIDAHMTQDVDLFVDTNIEDLYAGTYEALIEIACNDPNNPVAQVWVTLTVIGGPAQYYTVELHSNYFELISTYIDPTRFGGSPEEVFGIMPELVVAYQSDGGVYIPGVVNTMDDYDVAQGYRVYVGPPEGDYEMVPLTFTGDPIDPETLQYHVAAGRWNWMGYPFIGDVPVVDALSPIQDNLVIVMNDQGELWIPGLINTMGNMTTGEGYMIITNADVDFVYGGAPMMAAGNASDVWTIPEVENAPVATGLPYPVLVYLDENLKGYDPATIEIYDGDLLVGKAIVLEDRELTPVITWCGSAEHNLPGFTAGNEMRLVLRTATGTQIPIAATNLPTFGEGAYASVTIGANEALPTEFVVQNGYPNPFNPTVTVPFALPTAGEVTISVFNVLGQQVVQTSQIYEAGYHRYIFNASNQGQELVSGVYFMQVKYNGQVSTQKLMLLK